MTKIKEGTFLYQITHYSVRQIVIMLLGNVILALGASFFALTCMGTHPFYTMFYAAELLLQPISPLLTYANIMICLNVILFVIQTIFVRRQIGIGTIFNMFLFPYLNTWGLALLKWLNLPEMLGMRIVYLVLATLLMSLGLSIYQKADTGVAPYDAMPFVIMKHSRLPFFGSRMIVDGCCFVGTLILLFVQHLNVFNAGSASIGVGAIVCVFCMGPFVQFFDKTVSSKLIK